MNNHALYKAFIVLCILVTVPATGAAWTGFDIGTINPGLENRFKTTTVEVSLLNGDTATQNYNISFYLEQPNGTILKINGSKTGSIAGRSQLTFFFEISRDQMDLYGEYMFIANETVQGETTDVTYEVIPRFEVVTKSMDVVKKGKPPNIHGFILDLRDVEPPGLDRTAIQPGNFTITRLEPNGSYTTVLERPATLEGDMGGVEGNSVVAVINESRLPNGDYKIDYNASVQSQNNTKTYIVDPSDVFKVTPANTDIPEAVIYAVLVALAGFLYTGFKLRRRHSVMATFMVLVAHTLTWVGVFLASMMARTSGMDAVAGVLEKMFLGLFMAFFVFLAYMALIVYTSDAFDRAWGRRGKTFG